MTASQQRQGEAGMGLSHAEAEARLAQFGPNELVSARHISPVTILLRQFTGLLVLILIGAAVIALLLGEGIDAVAILLVVLLNAILGFVQEWRAENAIEALRAMLSPHAMVVRDGREQVIDARLLVPGDLVIVEAGDRVPADMDASIALQLRVDESVLTGESVPLSKSAASPDQARLFMGTSVVSGRAEGLVRATGANTEFGQIAELTEIAGEKHTHLQRSLSRLARQMGIAGLGIAAGVALVGLLSGRAGFEMLMTGLSLAVAIVPEGLPAVVTITLALGASAMVRRRALARRLQAVENLGAASVICTDKTGTLTENKMTAQAIWTAGQNYAVTGTGYDPAGHIARDGARIRAADDSDLGDLLSAGLTCTHAHLQRSGEDWDMVGDPTEGALITLGMKGWAEIPAEGTVHAELPFSSERKMMSVLARRGDGLVTFAKGAPEQILAASSHLRRNGETLPLTDDLRAEAEAAHRKMGEDGLRVIALAMAPMPGQAIDPVEEDLELLGFVGLIDPPRPEVAEAVATAQSAGIRVMMITGDSPETGLAVARQVGIPADRVMIGAALEALSDAELETLLKQDVLFARTRPGDKMRIVQALQRAGLIVGMTGDGVNDAPALKQADIGIAMGQRGTDVSKDAADLILLDDNFATIIGAIAEGRRQYANVQKFVRYLLASNAGEVVALLANILIGGPLILLATQILWMNLITDGVTAVALGLEKPIRDQMKAPPRQRNDSLLGIEGFAIIALFGLYTGTATLWLFYQLLPQGEDIARTTAFTAMVVFEKVSVFAFRAGHLPNWRIGWLSNPLLVLAFFAMLATQVAAVYWPPLQAMLKTAPLQAEHWTLIALCAAPLLIVPELLKTFGALRR
ncbi:MAG: cation-transporting P-type ATPase [Rhodobacteraceae bacterium]|nr:cation-transporting P-type ATPase [Paracoccaceae bacterium]